MDKQIMTFQIFIDKAQISDLKSPCGAVTMIPFTGRVESELFSGEILPGGVDVQVEDPAGTRHMCARYLFRGRDSAGAECQLFVENNAYYAPAQGAAPYISACPKFLTDSETLRPYLCQSRFRAEVHNAKGGVEIRIFDVLGE
ncbi:MAG: DUF3237 domain-containing protein [Clostridiales bacterium]|nr:DUF3237 domain-containing protein [Clostridiales bacterium]